MKLYNFDSEQDGFLDTCTRTWCISVVDQTTDEVWEYGPDQIKQGLKKLEEADVLFGHNILGHDLPVFRKLYGWDFKGKVVDTLIMSRTQRPERRSPPHCPNKHAPHSVEAWGYRLGDHKLEHEDWTQFSEAMMKRCTQDAKLQKKIYQFLLNEGKGEGWAACHRLNMRLFDLLQRQKEHGWYVDRAHIDRCLAELDRWIVRIDAAVVGRLPYIVEPQEQKEYGQYKYVKKPFLKNGKPAEITVRWYGDDAHLVGGQFTRIAFRKVDLDSNAETKDFLLGLGWDPLEWNTNNAGQRTSPKLSKDDPFIGVQGGLGSLIVRRVKCRHRAGTLKGLREAIRADGTISPGVGGVASTGRIRHSVIVNIPSVDSGSFYGRQMRAVFIARPGKVIVGADSKGNQVRQLAARMGDPAFTKAVLFGSKEENNDHHAMTQKASGVKTRTLAKNVFYGTVFGAQDKKIGKIVGGGPEEGKKVRENLFLGLPLLKALIDRLTEEWRDTAVKTWNARWNKWEYSNGYITGVDGRPILVDSEHKILNYALQSDEAIQMAWAYVYVHDAMEKLGYVLHKHWSMLIWYHDEFQAECEPELKDILGKIMCDAIRVSGEHYGIACPHAGEYKVGNNWADTH